VTTESGRRLHPEGRPADNPFRTLPARVAAEDLVAEVDVSPTPLDPTTDPNREVVARWGAGMVGIG
jgi:hypothetical protein